MKHKAFTTNDVTDRVLSWQHESETVQMPGTTLCNAIARLSLQRPGFDPSQFVSDLWWTK